ncbi:UNVERIFIED_ORG: putative cobalt transporter CbtA [Nocardia globerula]|uniref:Putative cobalt transporter CbtA n=1 Tax=Nocardia globerula TaxID=1818 RepID=A0A652YV23_NOCGL|nr:CbtA family protein [Rhodococcus globerulus]NMD60535.1 CbtA family protein [Nocardia globerula]PVX67921.1 putative cobalt transporter CbtA [Rhodococcus globerulus]
MPLVDNFTKLLIRGLLAGLIAGILAGGVAFVLGEPHVNAAIAIEEANSAAGETAGHSHGDEEAPLVSRDGQRAGLFLATSLAGLALGAIFAVVANYARRITTMSGPLLVMAIALGGWLAIEAVPFFKYPANPPAVGDPDTINQRTWLWLATVILGLLAVTAAAAAAKAVSAHEFLSVRVAAPVAAFLVIVAIGYLSLPTINEVGDDFPATLLWEFRLSSVATQATLWLALGLAFAFLTERATKDADVAKKFALR